MGHIMSNRTVDRMRSNVTASVVEREDVRPVPCPAIVLAGGRASPDFVRTTGISNRALIRLGNVTLLEIIVNALNDSSMVSDIYVVTSDTPPDGTIQIDPADSFVGNVLAGLDRCESAERAVIATSDMPFVHADAVRTFVTAATRLDTDLVYPITPVGICRASYPDLKRTALALREGVFTGGNMVVVRPAALQRIRGRILEAYDARKSPLRLAAMLGPGITAGVLLTLITRRGWLGLRRIETAASRLLRIDCRALVIDDPVLATDLDRPEDLEIILKMKREQAN